MKWQKKLTKEERHHMRTSGANTIAGMRDLRERQKELTNGKDEVCHHCKAISQKLGIE